MKKVVIQSEDISPKQWSNLILELNLIRKAWKPYARIQILGRGVKKIVQNGTRRYKIQNHSNVLAVCIREILEQKYFLK